MNAPPFLVSFSSVDDYLSSLTPNLRDRYGDEICYLANKGLPPVVSTQCLATLFGFTTTFVYAMKDHSWKYYRNFSIRKGKKKREIQAPKVSIKVIQKWFGFHLAKHLRFDDYVYGFIEGRSAIDAAAFHTEAKWIYSVDIKDFFPSTKKQVLIPSLKSLGYSDDACNLITSLCCYYDALPQGAPSSPVLSNLAMKDIDVKLQQLSLQHNIRFTRYADDIVFSGKSDFPLELKDQVKVLFEQSCWELSPQKEYFAQLPNRLKVHGLLVHQEKPRLTKGYRNKIRAYKHLLALNKVNRKDINRLLGHVKYSDSVDNYKS